MLPIICLMGPTASGKTALAVELVQQFPLEIVSVDSAMVYREMDIGTAKPTVDILRIAPHRLIDIKDPVDPYSAALFCEDAITEIKNIYAMKKIPLLVGGTMLYFHALQTGLSQLPSADEKIRQQIFEEAQAKGWPFLHDQLQKVDPQLASRIHPHDAQRISRGLEVFQLTGIALSQWQDKKQKSEDFKFYNFAIAPEDRSILHKRIETRFKEMLEKGFIEEVEKLYKRDDLSLSSPSMKSVGYRQVWQYLAGNLTHVEMVEKGIIATRQLAKRQLTWLRGWKDLEWTRNFNELREKLLLCKLFDST